MFAPLTLAEDTCYLFLIRHGATKNNLIRPPVLQGRDADPPLSEEGEAQAALTRDWLAAQPINAFYASTMRRAEQTAQIIAEPHRQPVTTLAEFIEAHVGAWEGKTWQWVEREHPEEYRNFMDDPGRHGYLGGESFADVQMRAVPVIERIVNEHLGQLVTVVAHNVVNRAILAHAMDFPLKYSRRIQQSNCGVNLLRYRDGQFKVLTVNGVFHLRTGAK